MSSSKSNLLCSRFDQRLTSIASHFSLRQKVVICRDLGSDVMPKLRKRTDLDLVVWPENNISERKWVLHNVPGSSGILVMPTEKVDAELLDAAGPQLKVISTMSVGYDHVDTKEMSKRGLPLGYTPDVLTDAVADLGVMLALMAGRNVKKTSQLVQEGQWPDFNWAPFAFCGPQLSTNDSSPTRTVGFLGFGRISHATLARLIPFGVTHCIYSTRPNSPLQRERDEALAKKHGLKEVRRVDYGDLAKESDVIFVLAPGGPATRHLVNEEFLRKMRKHSVLVNVSRGTLVDSDALAKALKEAWIWGAALDVVEGEPNVTADHPLVKEPRCVVLPHIGSATNEARLGMANLAVANLLAGLKGEKLPASAPL